jgi:hypothetical protein
MDVKVKHITKACPFKGCDTKAFVQVVIVEETALQPKIDRRANAKLLNTLKQQHQEGLHD